MLQRHLAVKLLLICKIEKMTENVLPSICQKIICSHCYVVHWKIVICLWCWKSSIYSTHCMCKELPVILVNKAVDPKKNNGKNWWQRRRRGKRGRWHTQKNLGCHETVNEIHHGSTPVRASCRVCSGLRRRNRRQRSQDRPGTDVTI
jgi:hypothetical protein